MKARTITSFVAVFVISIFAQVAIAQEECADLTVSSFGYPVVGISNNKDLDPREDGWHLNNGKCEFGAQYCKGTTEYHPGEDYLKKEGTDTEAAEGKNVYAIADGKIIFVKKYGDISAGGPKNLGYGVRIIHNIGDSEDMNLYRMTGTSVFSESWNPHTQCITSGYIHLDSIESDITEGANVTKGQLIGTIGDSPDFTAHLHFDMRLYGNGTLIGFPQYQIYSDDLTTQGLIDPTYFIKSRQTDALPIGCSDCIVNCWDEKKEITIDHELVSGEHDFHDFVVTINSDVLPSDFSEKVNSDGSDIRFTSDPDGNVPIAFEIDYGEWNSDVENAVIYVKIPLLKVSTDTKFYVWYGNEFAQAIPSDDIYGSNTVWDEDYKAVWHLGEQYGMRFDSTMNENHLESYNGVNSTQSVIGKGAWFGGYGSGHYMEIANTDNTGLDTRYSLTFSAWINIHDLPSQYGSHKYVRIFSRSNSSSYSYKYSYSWTIYQKYGKMLYSWWATKDSDGRPYERVRPQLGLEEHTSYYINLVRDSEDGKVRFYVNGEEVSSSDARLSSLYEAQGGKFRLSEDYSKYAFSGTMDEVRFSDAPRDADYIRTQYNNQSNPSAFATTE